MTIEQKTPVPESPMAVDGEENRQTKPVRRRALTSKQERRLVDYLDERILQCTRNHRKRNEESSTLRTLTAYLEEIRHILALILQIPPIDPSTGLRTHYLLRLTGDCLSAITGYTIERKLEEAQDLVDFLDDLDQAWIAVLQGQAWDPDNAEGVDVMKIAEHTDEDEAMDGERREMTVTLPNQTDTTRLRSLLIGGKGELEDWLLEQSGEHEGEEFSLTGTLQRMGLLEDYDDVFTRTLGRLGELSGEGEFGGEVDEDDDMDMEEVPMSDPFGYKLPDPDPDDD